MPVRNDGIAPVRARIARRSAALADIQAHGFHGRQAWRHAPEQLRDEGGVARGLLPEHRALGSRHREKRLHLPEEGRRDRSLAHDRERAVHRPEPRAASLAQASDETSVAARGGAERPGARPVPGAPGLDRPKETGIEGAAGTWNRCAHPCKDGAVGGFRKSPYLWRILRFRCQSRHGGACRPGTVKKNRVSGLSQLSWSCRIA